MPGAGPFLGQSPVMFLPLPKLACVQLPFPLCLLLSLPTPHPPTITSCLHLFYKNLISEIVIPEKNITQDKISEPNEFTTRGRCLPSRSCVCASQFPFQFKIAALGRALCSEWKHRDVQDMAFLPWQWKQTRGKVIIPRIQLLYQKHVLYLGEKKTQVRQNAGMRM